MIAIINFGVGNIGSVVNMLRSINSEVADLRIAHNPDDLCSCTKIILPGVGAFDHGIENLRSKGFVECLNALISRQEIKVLGICLGMQLMCKSSEEGQLPGLGWFDAEVKRFPSGMTDENGRELKVPHMGWNDVKQAKEFSLFVGLEDPRYYFVHSYYVKSNDKEAVLATTGYGLEFVSALAKDNIMAVQFHPEKSHRFGKQLLKNFLEMK